MFRVRTLSWSAVPKWKPASIPGGTGGTALEVIRCRFPLSHLPVPLWSGNSPRSSPCSPVRRIICSEKKKQLCIARQHVRVHSHDSRVPIWRPQVTRQQPGHELGLDPLLPDPELNLADPERCREHLNRGPVEVISAPPLRGAGCQAGKGSSASSPAGYSSERAKSGPRASPCTRM
jgi:hypothetical protein